MENKKRVSIKGEKDIYTKGWGVEIRSYPVTSQCTSS